MPSGRWSPEIQSAVLERGHRVRERVPDLRLHQDVRRHIGVLTPPPKGWTGRRSDVLTHLLAGVLEGSAAGSHIVQQGLPIRPESEPVHREPECRTDVPSPNNADLMDEGLEKGLAAPVIPVTKNFVEPAGQLS